MALGINVRELLPAGTLLGRGSASGAGPVEVVTLGAGITITGTQASATGGGSAAWTDFVKDIGKGTSGAFDITGLTDLTPGRSVAIVQTAQPIPSKGNATDEMEMDAIVLTGRVTNATTIHAVWRSTAIVTGDYAFAYQVGG